jgi:hypothetical protein
LAKEGGVLQRWGGHSRAEWLGRLYEEEKKPDLAPQHYQAALTLDPQNKTLREALKKLQKR